MAKAGSRELRRERCWLEALGDLLPLQMERQTFARARGFFLGPAEVALEDHSFPCMKQLQLADTSASPDSERLLAPYARSKIERAVESVALSLGPEWISWAPEDQVSDIPVIHAVFSGHQPDVLLQPWDS